MREHKIQKQCKSCPWRVDVVPERDIPNYDKRLHENLKRTIRSDTASLRKGPMMACHNSVEGEEFVCAGWLANQIGPGNNLGMRVAVMTGQLPEPVVEGPQHETLEDTLGE